MANYKTSWVQRLIEGAWQKTFAFAHAKTVYTDYANKKTLADKLSEIDTEIGNKANKTEIPNELPANGGNSATVNGHTVKSDVPENAVFTDTVYDDTDIKEEFTKAIDNLEIGCRNLVLNSSFNNNLRNWFVSSSDIVCSIVEGRNNNRALQMVIDSFTRQNINQKVINKGIIAKGDTFTLSFWYKISSDNPSNCGFFIRNNGSPWTELISAIGTGFVFDGEWHYFTKSGVCEGPDLYPNDIYLYFLIAAGTFTVSEIKLEKGNKATDWTPAPEDIETEMDNSIIELSMLGWSVPRECPVQNEVSGNQFVQKVGRVDLGSLDWEENLESVPSHKRLVSMEGTTNYIKAAKSNDDAGNIFISKYTNTSANDSYNHVTDKSISVDISSRLWVYDSSYADVDSFKQAMQGQYLYYELETPITTTIDGNEIGETVSDVRKETTVNLLNSTFKTTTQNGVTRTNNGDGTYTFSGTATSETIFRLGYDNNLIVGKTYKVLGMPITGSDSTIRMGWDYHGYFYNKNGLISTKTSDSRPISLIIAQGYTCDNLVIKPMFTTNLNATYDDFVPYTGDSGSLNWDVSEKAPKENPLFTGSISMGRKADSTVGANSTAEGIDTTASGDYSHAEGRRTTASDVYSHAEGDYTTANGDSSHAEGYYTTASGASSHAEGSHTTSSGDSSHAEGDYTTASGAHSHAEGYGTESLLCQHAGGHYNNTTVAINSKISGTGTGTSFVIGNGTAGAKSNAFRVDDNGTPYSKAGLNTTGADYAEFFEWQDGNKNNEDRRGYFVTLDGKHIKIANEGDWILGIVSGFPAIIGNGDEEWKGRYVFDDFGCPVIEEFEYEEEEYETITNDDGEEEVITKKVKRTGTKWKEVTEYDPTQPYTGRMQRKEWAAIGMLGVLSVRDDGSCKVNGFCKLADGGIATASDTGYRVVKRVTDNIVEVIFK